MSASILANTALPLFLAGCGDPLVDGDYRGEPLLSVHGAVLTNYSPTELGWPDGELRVTIDWAEWSGDGGRSNYDASELETFTSFPSRYRLHVYLPPPDAALFRPPWAGDRQIAIGTPLLYIDRNGNGQWDYGADPVVGGSEDTVAVYLMGDRPLSDNYITLQPGFQLMWAVIDYCSEAGAEGEDVFFSKVNGPVNLLVGDLWDQLKDWACDGPGSL